MSWSANKGFQFLFISVHEANEQEPAQYFILYFVQKLLTGIQFYCWMSFDVKVTNDTMHYWKKNPNYMYNNSLNAVWRTCPKFKTLSTLAKLKEIH